MSIVPLSLPQPFFGPDGLGSPDGSALATQAVSATTASAPASRPENISPQQLRETVLQAARTEVKQAEMLTWLVQDQIGELRAQIEELVESDASTEEAAFDLGRAQRELHLAEQLLAFKQSALEAVELEIKLAEQEQARNEAAGSNADTALGALRIEARRAATAATQLQAKLQLAEADHQVLSAKQALAAASPQAARARADRLTREAQAQAPDVSPAEAWEMGGAMRAVHEAPQRQEQAQRELAAAQRQQQAAAVMVLSVNAAQAQENFNRNQSSLLAEINRLSRLPRPTETETRALQVAVRKLKGAEYALSQTSVIPAATVAAEVQRFGTEAKVLSRSQVRDTVYTALGLSPEGAGTAVIEHMHALASRIFALGPEDRLKGLGNADAQQAKVRVIPMMVTSPELGMLRDALFEVHCRDGNQTVTRLVHQSGVYTDLQDFLAHNELPEHARITLPENAWLAYDDSGNLKLATIAAHQDSAWASQLKGHAANSLLFIGGAALEVGAFASSFYSAGTTAPAGVVMHQVGHAMVLAAIGNMATSSGYDILSRAQHDRSLSLADPGARAAWLTLAASVGGGFGMIARGLAQGAEQATAAALNRVAGRATASSGAIQAWQSGESIYNLAAYGDQMSAGQRKESIGGLVENAGLMLLPNAMRKGIRTLAPVDRQIAYAHSHEPSALFDLARNYPRQMQAYAQSLYADGPVGAANSQSRTPFPAPQAPWIYNDALGQPTLRRQVPRALPVSDRSRQPAANDHPRFGPAGHLGLAGDGESNHLRSEATEPGEHLSPALRQRLQEITADGQHEFTLGDYTVRYELGGGMRLLDIRPRDGGRPIVSAILNADGSRIEEAEPYAGNPQQWQQLVEQGMLAAQAAAAIPNSPAAPSAATTRPPAAHLPPWMQVDPAQTPTLVERLELLRPGARIAHATAGTLEVRDVEINYDAPEESRITVVRLGNPGGTLYRDMYRLVSQGERRQPHARPGQPSPEVTMRVGNTPFHPVERPEIWFRANSLYPYEQFPVTYALWELGLRAARNPDAPGRAHSDGAHERYSAMFNERFANLQDPRLVEMLLQHYEATGEDLARSAVMRTFEDGMTPGQLGAFIRTGADPAGNVRLIDDLSMLPIEVLDYRCRQLWNEGLRLALNREQIERYDAATERFRHSLGQYTPERRFGRRVRQNELTVDLRNLQQAAGTSGQRVAAGAFMQKYHQQVLQALAPEIRREIDLVVPMPSVEQSTNELADVALSVGRLLGKPASSTALLETQENRSQAGLDETSRLINKVFLATPTGDALRPENNVEGKVILLIDDVLGTGKTAEVARQTLMRAGAKAVHVLALADTTYREPRAQAAPRAATVPAVPQEATTAPAVSGEVVPARTVLARWQDGLDPNNHGVYIGRLLHVPPSGAIGTRISTIEAPISSEDLKRTIRGMSADERPQPGEFVMLEVDHLGERTNRWTVTRLDPNDERIPLAERRRPFWPDFETAVELADGGIVTGRLRGTAYAWTLDTVGAPFRQADIQRALNESVTHPQPGEDVGIRVDYLIQEGGRRRLKLTVERADFFTRADFARPAYLLNAQYPSGPEAFAGSPDGLVVGYLDNHHPTEHGYAVKVNSVWREIQSSGLQPAIEAVRPPLQLGERIAIQHLGASSNWGQSFRITRAHELAAEYIAEGRAVPNELLSPSIRNALLWVQRAELEAASIYTEVRETSVREEYVRLARRDIAVRVRNNEVIDPPPADQEPAAPVAERTRVAHTTAARAALVENAATELEEADPSHEANVRSFAQYVAIRRGQQRLTPHELLQLTNTEGTDAVASALNEWRVGRNINWDVRQLRAYLLARHGEAPPEAVSPVWIPTQSLDWYRALQSEGSVTLLGRVREIQRKGRDRINIDVDTGEGIARLGGQRLLAAYEALPDDERPVANDIVRVQASSIPSAGFMRGSLDWRVEKVADASALPPQVSQSGPFPTWQERYRATGFVSGTLLQFEYYPGEPERCWVRLSSLSARIHSEEAAKAVHDAGLKVNEEIGLTVTGFQTNARGPKHFLFQAGRLEDFSLEERQPDRQLASWPSLDVKWPNLDTALREAGDMPVVGFLISRYLDVAENKSITRLDSVGGRIDLRGVEEAIARIEPPLQLNEQIALWRLNEVHRNVIQFKAERVTVLVAQHLEAGTEADVPRHWREGRDVRNVYVQLQRAQQDALDAHPDDPARQAEFVRTRRVELARMLRERVPVPLP